MHKLDLVKISAFLISQAVYLGDHILVPNQGKATIAIDESKELPSGAQSAIAQAHCSIDDIAQEHFLTELSKRYPLARIIAEEDTSSVQLFPTESDDCFYADPNDGTHNFGENSPDFGVSLGYAYRNQMRLAVIYLPRHNFLFASCGEGVYLNGDRINIDSAHVSTSGDLIILNSKISEQVETVLREQGFKTHRPHCTVAGLSLVARNKAKAYVAINTNVYDVAPFSFILEQEKAVVTRFDGTKPDYSKHAKIDDFIVSASRDYSNSLLSRMEPR